MNIKLILKLQYKIKFFKNQELKADLDNRIFKMNLATLKIGDQIGVNKLLKLKGCCIINLQFFKDKLNYQK